jgi:hypothetical protein
MDLSILAALRERVEPGCPEALLHEGLPTTAGIRSSGDGLAAIDGDLVDAWLRSRPDRRTTGLYLTRPDAARNLLRLATTDGVRPRRVLDPAVGAGVFLEEAWHLFGPDVELHGIDIDPVAVALTRLALWRRRVVEDPEILARRIRWEDALRFPTPRREGGFDLVCGNPPFGNAIERRTGRAATDQRELRARFPETAAGPYDRSVLFVHLATQVLDRHGRYALLIPRALLSARYATGLRGLLDRGAPPRHLVVYGNDAPAPACAIAMVGLIGGPSTGAQPVEVVGEAGGVVRTVPRTGLTDSTWGALVDPDGGARSAGLDHHPTFGDLFEVRASMTVAEAYAAREVLQEGGEGWRFLTSGLIDHHGDRWGRERARHLGCAYMRPVLPRATGRISTARENLFDRPKVIVAGLSRTLEARIDPEGQCAGSVGTLMLLARRSGPEAERQLLRAALLLNSAWLSTIHRARRGPQALSGGSIPLGRRDVEAFPFPRPLAGSVDPQSPIAAHIDALDRVADALSRGPGVDEEDLRARGDALILEILLEKVSRDEPAKCIRSDPTSTEIGDRSIAADGDDLSL